MISWPMTLVWRKLDYVEMVADVDLRSSGDDTDILARVTGVDFVEDQLIVRLLQLDAIISRDSEGTSVEQGGQTLPPDQDEGVQISDFARQRHSLSNPSSQVAT